MLPRTHRLPASERLLHARRLSTPLYSVKILPTALSYSRVGIVIPKKVDKRAVVRNRNRRRLSHLMAGFLEQFLRKYDILFIIHQRIDEIDQQVLAKQLAELFKKQQML